MFELLALLWLCRVVVVCVCVCRGETNSYVILSLEGQYLGTNPTVHLYLGAEDVDPFLSSQVDPSADYTLNNGANYVAAMGERLICGGVQNDRIIQCAYFYGTKVRPPPPPTHTQTYTHAHHAVLP
jgi:hypothetical protein